MTATEKMRLGGEGRVPTTTTSSVSADNSRDDDGGAAVETMILPSSSRDDEDETFPASSRDDEDDVRFGPAAAAEEEEARCSDGVDGAGRTGGRDDSDAAAAAHASFGRRRRRSGGDDNDDEEEPRDRRNESFFSSSDDGVDDRSPAPARPDGRAGAPPSPLHSTRSRRSTEASASSSAAASGATAGGAGSSTVAGIGSLSLSYSASVSMASPAAADSPERPSGGGGRGGAARHPRTGGGRSQRTMSTYTSVTSTSRSRSSRTSSDLYSLAFSNSSGGTPLGTPLADGGGETTGNAAATMGTVEEGHGGNGAGSGGSAAGETGAETEGRDGGADAQPADSVRGLTQRQQGTHSQQSASASERENKNDDRRHQNNDDDDDDDDDDPPIYQVGKKCFDFAAKKDGAGWKQRSGDVSSGSNVVEEDQDDVDNNDDSSPNRNAMSMAQQRQSYANSSLSNLSSSSSSPPKPSHKQSMRYPKPRMEGHPPLSPQQHQQPQQLQPIMTTIDYDASAYSSGGPTPSNRGRIGSAEGSVRSIRSSGSGAAGAGAGNRPRITSDDVPRHLPPVHNFFTSVLGGGDAVAAPRSVSPRCYDSDGSGSGSGKGSVVFANGQGQPSGGGGGVGVTTVRGRHERFSSVNSSGSFVRRHSPRPVSPVPYAAQPYPSSPYRRGSDAFSGGTPPSGAMAMATEATPNFSNVTRVTPGGARVLPYHQRRKLMQQKRREEEEEEETAPRRQAQHDGQRWPGHDQWGHGRGQGHRHGQQQIHPRWRQPPPHSAQPLWPGAAPSDPVRPRWDGYPPSAAAHRARQHHQHHNQQQQQGQQQWPQPMAAKGPVGPGQQGTSGKQQQQQQHSMWSRHNQLRPSGYGSGGSGHGGNRLRLSSADSIDRDVGGAAGGDRGGAPTHVQTDSNAGSVSSLGSHMGGPGSLAAGPMRSLTDRLGGDIAGFLKDSQRREREEEAMAAGGDGVGGGAGAGGGGGGFPSNAFGGMSTRPSGMGPTKASASFRHHQRNLSIEEETQEFHQKNRAFLHKAEKEKVARTAQLLLPSAPPIAPRPMRPTSPHPPNTRGAHRPGLPSIDNDNWEDETPESQRGQGARRHHGGHDRHAANGSHRHRHDMMNGARPKRNGERDGYGSTALVAAGCNDFSHGHVESRSSSRGTASAGGDSRSRRSGRSGRRTHQRWHDSTTTSDESPDSIAFSSDDTSDEESSEFDASSFLGSMLSADPSTGAPAEEEGGEEEPMRAPTERTSLLPPPGISTHESHSGLSRPRSTPDREESRKRRKRSGHCPREQDGGRRGKHRSGRESRRHGKEDRRDGHRHRSQHNGHRFYRDDYGRGDTSDSSESSTDYERRSRKKADALEKERARLISQWKAEARAEMEAMRAEEEARRWHNRLWRWGRDKATKLADGTGHFLANAEAVISNMPSTIGAVAMAIVTLGVVWFKFAEENLDSCEPVHFHSSQCTFPEFPGCFYCNTSGRMYRVAVNFHFVCSAVAGVLVLVFFAKIVIAFRVVIDELSSPTTSSPAGLICMTSVCVFAGRGWIGEFLVCAAAAMHLCIVLWFLYMALAYRILPDPSWYPNTVGLGLSAVKTWLYFGAPGRFLMAISLSLNIFFFPISVFRVSLNKKISAPVGWIQMSAPAVALYALTIMAQPSFEEEQPDITAFQHVHRMVYLPCMHFMFILSMIGAFSSAQSLYARWDSFSKKEFSPAHAAFCFPTLAHANAVQAYRGAVNSFSDIKPGSPFKILIYVYWVFVLVGGTIATIIITAKFFSRIPSWTLPDLEEEEEPPAPNETVMVTADGIFAGETMRQDFVSPAVLQANETGVLVALPRDHGRVRYRRTRKVTALGFDPIMNLIELNEERDALLEMVAKNPPRRRKRTLSVPGIDFRYEYGDFGTGNAGVYDVEAGRAEQSRRSRRANTGLY